MATIERLDAAQTESVSSKLAPIVAEMRASRVKVESRDSEVTIDGVTVTVPGPVRDALVDVLSHFAAGKAVAIGPVDSLLTTTQAADILAVSRQYVCRLVDEGVLPAEYRGTHRRLKLDDLLAYRTAQQVSQTRALDRISELARTEGLYDDDF